MKLFTYALLTSICCLSVLAQAAEITEDDVLHATFAAFQEPGVLSQEYINQQQSVLEMAAKDGNSIARLVVNKNGDRADGQGTKKELLMSLAQRQQ